MSTCFGVYRGGKYLAWSCTKFRPTTKRSDISRISDIHFLRLAKAGSLLVQCISECPTSECLLDHEVSATHAPLSCKVPVLFHQRPHDTTWPIRTSIIGRMIDKFVAKTSSKPHHAFGLSLSESGLSDYNQGRSHWTGTGRVLDYNTTYRKRNITKVAYAFFGNNTLISPTIV